MKMKSSEIFVVTTTAEQGKEEEKKMNEERGEEGKDVPVNRMKSRFAEKWQILKEVAADWGQRSSFHGLPGLASPGLILVKLIWIACCLASWIFFLIQMFSLINKFNSHDVISSVSAGYQVPAPFPGLYISYFSFILI